MSGREQCGDYEIYQTDDGWWEVKKITTDTIIGKFQKKEDALEKIAVFLQDDEERIQEESVC